MATGAGWNVGGVPVNYHPLTGKVTAPADRSVQISPGERVSSGLERHTPLTWWARGELNPHVLSDTGT
jgi:hypothetical protein